VYADILEELETQRQWVRDVEKVLKAASSMREEEAGLKAQINDQKVGACVSLRVSVSLGVTVSQGVYV